MTQKSFLLYVITEDWGLFTHRIDLARRAQKAGYRVGIACSVKNHGKKIEAENFDLYPLKSLKRGSLNPFRDVLAFWELFSLYRKIRPDILHQVALKPVLYGSIAARLAKVPAIVNALGGLGYLFIDTSFKVKSIRFFLLRLLKWAFHCKNVSLILQNPEDKKVFRKLISPQQLYLIRGSGVNLNVFHPPLSLKQKKKSLLKAIVCCRLLWDKGIGEVIEAARLLKEKKVPLRLQIVGASDPENPSSIPESFLKSWRQENIIDFLGSRDDIPMLLQESDIAVLPSYREGLPKALLEAAATGLPLVATDVPGCREIVQDGINGFLVPVKDAQKLAEVLEALACDASLRQKMGKESLKLVKDQFSEEKINTEILEIYKKQRGFLFTDTSRKA
ncbi:MAG: glycosyltransferase family 4 protein [Proteobacteria bacterium]|nr:glycosyltransferase family 4 protein [Pseudomonadota bacterium]